MKRASLKSVKVSMLANPSPDMTDRLLKSDEQETKTTVAPRPPQTPPPPPKPRRARKSSPTDSSAQPAAPLPAASTLVPEPGTISHALAQSRLALAALLAARDSAPARYNLAVRYRLDALAHHLEQVTQFVTSQTP